MKLFCTAAVNKKSFVIVNDRMGVEACDLALACCYLEEKVKSVAQDVPRQFPGSDLKLLRYFHPELWIFSRCLKAWYHESQNAIGPGYFQGRSLQSYPPFVLCTGHRLRRPACPKAPALNARANKWASIRISSSN